MDDTVGGHASSYIAGVMRPVYNLCMEQRGMLSAIFFPILSLFFTALMQNGSHRNGK